MMELSWFAGMPAHADRPLGPAPGVGLARMPAPPGFADLMGGDDPETAARPGGGDIAAPAEGALDDSDTEALVAPPATGPASPGPSLPQGADAASQPPDAGAPAAQAVPAAPIAAAPGPQPPVPGPEGAAGSLPDPSGRALPAAPDLPAVAFHAERGTGRTGRPPDIAAAAGTRPDRAPEPPRVPARPIWPSLAASPGQGVDGAGPRADSPVPMELGRSPRPPIGPAASAAGPGASAVLPGAAAAPSGPAPMAPMRPMVGEAPQTATLRPDIAPAPTSPAGPAAGAKAATLPEGAPPLSAPPLPAPPMTLSAGPAAPAPGARAPMAWDLLDSGLRPIGDGGAPVRAQPAPPLPGGGASGRGLLAAVVAHIRAEAPGSTTEIRLDPPELGRLRIALNASDGQIVATIHADRPEVQEYLRRNADDLLRDLRLAGYGEARLDLGSGGAAPERDHRPPAPVPIAGAEVPPDAAATPSAAADDRIDIRL